MASPIDHHKKGLIKLHESEEFSDCKLICGPYHFNLHRVILASQSDYFRAAFKQGTFKEGDTGIIELKTAQSDDQTSAEGDEIYDEPEIVKLMVEYFYHFDYLRDTESLPHPAASLQLAARTARNSFATTATQTAKREHVRVRLPPPDVQPQQHEHGQLPSQGYIIEHVKVFAIAVKYQIHGLRGLAASKFKDAATAYWKHDDFVEAIYIIYSSTAEEDTQLRDIVTEILHQHFEDLEDSPVFEAAFCNILFEAAFCNIPRPAYTLLKIRRGEKKHGNMEIGKQSQPAVQKVDCSECSRCGHRLPRNSWYCRHCWDNL